MLLTRARAEYDRRTRFVGKCLSAAGFSPDAVTLIGTMLGLVAALSLWHGHFLLSALFIVLSGLADASDGAVARHQGRQHPFGTVFDRVNDRYVEFFIMTGCIGSGHVHPAWGVFALTGGFMASYVRACAESAGRVANCSVGLVERVEKLTLVLLGVLAEPVLNPRGLLATHLLPWHYPAADGVMILQYCVIAVGTLSHVTVLQRLRHAKDHENEV